jgi:hypothetical protein
MANAKKIFIMKILKKIFQATPLFNYKVKPGNGTFSWDRRKAVLFAGMGYLEAQFIIGTCKSGPK